MIKQCDENYEGSDPVKESDIIIPQMNCDDAFGPYGHGVSTYFCIQRSLILIFILLTILSGPITHIYSLIDNDDLPFVATHSVGNLLRNNGNSYCAHMFVGHNEPLLLKCPKGKINKFVYTGAIPNTDIGFHDFCFDYQKLTEEDDYIHQCSNGYLDQRKVQLGFKSLCLNNEQCSFNLVSYLTHPV